MRNLQWVAIAAMAAPWLFGIANVDAQISTSAEGQNVPPASFPLTGPPGNNHLPQDQTIPVTEIELDATLEVVDDSTVEQLDDAGIIYLPPTSPEYSESIIVEESPGVDIEFHVGNDKEDDDDDERRSFGAMGNTPYSVYRSEQKNVTWLPGSGDHFGMVDWTTDSYLTHDDDSGFSVAYNIHWLSGPTAVPLQSRVYDFIWAYQTRGHLSPAFSYDLSTSIGIYSDFEGSAREGVRFPSHAVGMLHFSHGVDLVFGIDYLDRDDIGLLPVFGISVRHLAIDGLRADLVFPRPRLEYTFNDEHRMYVSGELGGGSWDVEFEGIGGNVATYRDYRLIMGFESTDDDGDLSALEFGYVFDRNLEFRGRSGIELSDAFMINWVTRR